MKKLKVFKFIAISGSLRANSSNSNLLKAVNGLAPEHIDVTIYSGLDELPHFNPDLPIEKYESVMELKRSVDEADGLIISSPEYAHGVPGSLKNALDWLVGGHEFYEKPVAFFNASSRGTFANASLREIVRTMSGHIVQKACITVELLGKNLNIEDIQNNSDFSAKIRSALSVFTETIQNRA